MNKRIKYTKNLNVEELSKILMVEKDEIINNSDFLSFNIEPNKKMGFKKLNMVSNIYGYEFYKKEENKFLLVIYIFIFLALSITTTFCAINYYDYIKSNKNKANTGVLNINVDFKEDSNIKLHDTFPITLEEAKQLKPLKFTVKNIGTINGIYRIKLIDFSKEYKNDYPNYEKLDYKYIRYSLECINDKTIYKTGLLSELDINNKNNLNELSLLNSKIQIKTGYKEFDLRLWIDKDADNNASNKYFVGKVIIESESDNNEK